MKYGPNTAQVEHMIEQARRMTHSQRASLGNAWNVVQNRTYAGARESARSAVWVSSRDDAWNAVWDKGWTNVSGLILDAFWDAAVALIVRDLISKEHFDILYGPWDSLFGSPEG